MIAEKVGLSFQLVYKWRQRFLQPGLDGLYDEMRPGGPRSISDEQVAELIRKTLNTKPQNGTHWTIRSVAKGADLSRPIVHRIWKAFGLQPHRQRTFKLSSDPFFVEKVRDIVGLYLNPPNKAIILCVDEKGRIQALDRTQPLLSMDLGYVEGVTHDHIRHGTTTLFSTLDIAIGHVITRCKIHYTPTYASWLNQVEIWFNIVT